MSKKTLAILTLFSFIWTLNSTKGLQASETLIRPVPVPKSKPRLNLKLGTANGTQPGISGFSGFKDAHIDPASTHNSTHFHGSNSSSLTTFSKNSSSQGALIPRGKLAEKGIVPFSGEHASVNEEGSGEHYLIDGKHPNEEHLSTVNKEHAKGAFEYATKAFNQRKLSFSHQEVSQSSNAKLRKAQFDKLSETEKQLVKEPFPVVYGITPAAGQEILKPAEKNSNYNRNFGEEAIKGGVSKQEINVIYVPHDKKQVTEQYLKENGHAIPVVGHDFSENLVPEAPRLQDSFEKHILPDDQSKPQMRSPQSPVDSRNDR